MWAERKSRGRYRSLEMKLFRCPTGTPLDTRLTTNNGVVCVTPVYPVQTVLTFVKSGTGENKRILPETMEVKRIPIEMDGKKPYFCKFNRIHSKLQGKNVSTGISLPL